MKWQTGLKRLAWGLFGVLALWALAWLAVPPLLKSQLQSRLGESLGRTVSLGEIDFKPWTLELTVSNIVIGAVVSVPASVPASASAPAASPPGAANEPLLRVARVHVDAEIASMLRRAPVVQALEIDGLQLRVARTSAGHYDIDDLIAKLQPTAAPEPPSEPLHFALYNLRLRDAALWFDDRPMRKLHQVQAIHLALPFLSNLPAQIEVKVEPRLAFKFNGTPFDSGAQATPFASNRQGSLKLKTGALDLLPYLGYLPEGLPVRLARGSLAADLALDFEMPAGQPPRVVLRGTLDADQVQLNDAAGAPLVQWKRVALALHDVQPLARRVSLGELGIEAPQLHVSRDRQGLLNLLKLVAAPTAPAAPAAPAAPVAPAELAAPATSAAGSRTAASAAASAPPTPAAVEPWRIELAALKVSALRVLWNDAAVQPALSLMLDEVALRAGPLKWPLESAVPARLSAVLRAPSAAASGVELGRLEIDGQGSDQQAQAKLMLTQLALGSLAPYLASTLRPTVSGTLSASAQVDWSAGAKADAAGAAKAAGLHVSKAELSLDDLRITEPPVGKRPGVAALAWKQLALRDVDIDVAAHSLMLGSVKLQQPAASLQRDEQGEWNMARWPVAAASTPAAGRAVPAASTRAGGSPEAPWRVGVRELAVEGGQLRFSDAFADGIAGTAGAAPVQFDLAGVRLSVQNLLLNGARTSAPAKLQFSTRLTPGGTTADKRQAAATLGWRGQVGLQPLQARGSLNAERLPLHVFEPYFGHRLKLSLVRADAGLKAEVAFLDTPAGVKLDLKGEAVLADFLVQSRPVGGAGLDSAEDLLSWQSFALKGVTVALAPPQRPRVEVSEAVLSDFYSRLVITEQGRFNLQDVAPADAAASASASASASAASAPEPSDSTGPPLDIAVAATRLQRGSIDFTDRFVRPNYSAKLTELDGSLGAFRSGTREMATLSLRGRAAGTALLDISGQLNPTVQPLALDIRARATDLELAPLSPYAGKYAGYAIERGKLSMDVAYKISPDGTLDAKNQVVLNQLTFGDKIDSPSATRLPVLLAVALLKDRHGVIDINLPVSGSVNDPKFSVGAIIWKVILNLLVKALTAPFALLSGGGSDDLSLVEFVPGTSRVAESGSAALDKVAKALGERPALKITVTGTSDPVQEREAYQRAALESRLLAERKKELLRSGVANVGSPDAPVTLNAEDRTRLLKEVYRQTDLPDKPRNLVGFAKEVAPAEMETRLLPRTVVNDEAMRELALQRGLAVRDALIAKGLPSDRLFLAAPKLRGAAEAGAAAASAAPSAEVGASSPAAGQWTPRVQLSLSAN